MMHRDVSDPQTEVKPESFRIGIQIAPGGLRVVPKIREGLRTRGRLTGSQSFMGKV